MKKNIQYLFLTVFMTLICGACTKVVVRANEVKTNAVTKNYKTDLASVYEQSKITLEKMGYTLLQNDEAMQTLETRWQPTTSDSHFLPLFGRRDYSANQGGYYKLHIESEEQGSQVEVRVSTVLKSISGKLETSEVLEKRFLAKLSDALRSAQIEVNNVGMEEK